MGVAPAAGDAVLETSTTSGTGALTLAGSPSGPYQPFSTKYANTATAVVLYAIRSSTLSTWEVGLGLYTLSGTTLARNVVLDGSSGPGNFVSFGSESKNVFNDLASLLTNLPQSGQCVPQGSGQLHLLDGNTAIIAQEFSIYSSDELTGHGTGELTGIH